jgi:limonene-1,2-epoxide hydrolase
MTEKSSSTPDVANIQYAPIDVVRAFIRAWNDNDIDRAHEFMAEDIFYHNVPMQPIFGREAARAFCDSFGVGVRLFAHWEIVNIAASDDVVLTERVDSFSGLDGKTISVPLMGSFRVANSKIVEWRDYFDLATFERQLVGGSL